MNSNGKGRAVSLADIRAAQGPWVEPEQWLAQAAQHEGSWWPAWQAWLAARSSKRQRPRPSAATDTAVLGDAPGQYVMQRYRD